MFIRVVNLLSLNFKWTRTNFKPTTLYNYDCMYVHYYVISDIFKLSNAIFIYSFLYIYLLSSIYISV